MHSLVWLIPGLPVLAAAGIGLGYLAGWNRGEAGERFTAGIASIAALLALLLLLGIDGLAVLQGTPGQVSHGIWLHSGDYVVQLSFNLDTLGLALATLVALIALLTLRFSINYLHREAGWVINHKSFSEETEPAPAG